MITGIVLIIGMGLCLMGMVQLAQLCGQAGQTARNHRMARRCGRSEAAEMVAEVTRRASELALDVPAWSGWRAMNVIGIEEETSDCRSVYLGDSEGGPLPPFLPGQFVQVGLRNADRSITGRCYSLSEASLDSHWRITVKRLPGGDFSNRFLDAVQPGDSVMVQAPGGRFVPSADPRIPLVLVAAGIGVAPMVSIVRNSQLREPGRPIQMFYQVRDLQHAPLLKPLARWAADNMGVRLYLYLSHSIDPQPTWVAGCGRIDAATVLRKCGGPQGQFMLCVPPAMQASLVGGLRDGGVPAEMIRVESWNGEAQTTDGNTFPGRV